MTSGPPEPTQDDLIRVTGVRRIPGERYRNLEVQFRESNSETEQKTMSRLDDEVCYVLLGKSERQRVWERKINWRGKCEYEKHFENQKSLVKPASVFFQPLMCI